MTHPTYRTIDGREYVLVEHAEKHMSGMGDDALEAAARMTEQWGASTAGLADGIRGLKVKK